MPDNDFILRVLKAQKAYNRAHGGIVGLFRDYLDPILELKQVIDSGHPQELIAKINQEMNGDRASLFAGIPMLEANVLKELSVEQLSSIYVIVSSMNKLSDEAEKNPKYAEQSKRAIQAGRNAMSELSKNFEYYSTLRDFSAYTMSTDLDAGEYTKIGPKHPSAQDLELVAALKVVGIDINLETKEIAGPMTVTEWVLSSSKANDFAIKVGDTTPFIFKPEQVQSLIDNYLNVPVEDRGGNVITPNGLFAVLREENGPKQSKDELVNTQKDAIWNENQSSSQR